MKKRIGIISIFFLLIAVGAFALDVPALKGRVNDYAGILKSDDAQRLEKKLAQYETDTSTQIVVLTIPSLEGDVIEDFSIRVMDEWKIGQAGKDNGVILTIAKADRKMRIEVGYGLEGTVTDLISGQIIRKFMAPHFKEGDFYGGIDAAVDQIVLAAQGEFKADKEKSKVGFKGLSPMTLFCILAVVLFIVTVFLSGLLHKALGGIVGGAGLSVLGFMLLGAGPVAIVILAVVGLIVGAFPMEILSVLAEGGSSGGGSFSSGGGGGGFSGGGGGGGGGGASGGW